MVSTRKLGLIAGTAVTLGALVGGCPQPGNKAPEVGLSERNGTEIRATNSEGIAEEYGWDQAIILPINRDDVYNNDEKFTVTASDSDGPMALTGNVFPYDGTVGVHIEQGRNTQNTLDWNISLSGSNIPRGTYPLFSLEARDGMNTRTVGVLGAVSRGQSFEPPVDPNEPEPPYTIGDGVCSPGEPADSPDCVVEPPYIIGDGICDSDLGEPASSPDCQVEPPTFTPNDGVCEPDLGETWQNSTDCPIPDSAWAGTDIELYEGNDRINPSDDPGFRYTMPAASKVELNARLILPTSLDEALTARGITPQIEIFERGYHEGSPNYDPVNNWNCFYSTNVTHPPELISSSGGFNTRKVDFDAVHTGCEVTGPGYGGQGIEAFEAKATFSGTNKVYTDREEFEAVE